MKANLTTEQKADLYPDFYKIYKSGSPKGIAELTKTEIAMKWDGLMKEFLEEQKTFPGRERLRRLGFKIQEPANESQKSNRELAEV